MPAVKTLHVESGNNSKPEFIMGHSFQAISLLLHAGLGRMAAVPLAARIHEGVETCNANRRSLLDKLADLLSEIAAAIHERPLLLVADCGSRKPSHARKSPSRRPRAAVMQAAEQRLRGERPDPLRGGFRADRLRKPPLSFSAR